MRSRQTTWMFGGIGLISSGVLGMLWIGALRSSPAGLWMKGFSDVLYAVAVMFFAIGLSKAASIVARGALGIASIAVVGVWPLLEPVLAAINSPAPRPDAGMAPLTYVSLIVPTAAALVAVFQIARARVVPAPWNWAPLWVLIGQTLLWALPQVVLVATGPEQAPDTAGLLAASGLISFLGGTVGLGAVAIYLAARQRPDVTLIYRST